MWRRAEENEYEAGERTQEVSGGRESKGHAAPLKQETGPTWRRAQIRDAHSLVEEDVVLRAHAQVPPDGVHVRADVVAADEGGSRRGREQSRQNGPAQKNTPTAQDQNPTSSVGV